jgi:hypothetical protein
VVQETIHNRVENVGAEHNQKTEANTEKFEQDPGMMQSVEEHQDVPSEDVVRAVKGLRKRRRGRKITAGRRIEPKEQTRGYYGSRRKVTVARKRTSRHATVAWLKRKLFGRSGIQGNFGPRKELTADGMRRIAAEGTEPQEVALQAQPTEERRNNKEGRRDLSDVTRNNSSRVTFCVRSALTNSTTEFSVLSAPRLYNATLGIFAPVRYE